uniref:G-protein coupled receptors family 2 profile 2 domain-containing protein n=2 Tax=Amphimedon queenslandica TaxID=400682 RepID=A0A1X7ULZ4_AMPQE
MARTLALSPLVPLLCTFLLLSSASGQEPTVTLLSGQTYRGLLNSNLTINASIDATGNGSSLTAEWTLGHTKLSINSNEKYTVMNEVNPSTADGYASLTILELVEADAIDYTLTVVDSSNRETSVTATVEVQVPPAILLSPTNTTDIILSTVQLSCSSRGWPAPNITWLKDGAEILCSDAISISTFRGERQTVSTLVIGELKLENAGSYQCNASNELIIGRSVLSDTALITVLLKFDESVYTCMAVNNISNVLDTPETKAVFLRIQVPANVTPISPSPSFGVEGQSIVLTFSITQDDPLVNTSNIRWTFRGPAGLLDITESSDSRYELSSNRRSLAISHLLTSSDEGYYTVYATNEAGTQNASIQLMVEGPPKVYQVPEDLNVLENSTAFFRCLAIGDPTPDHAWYYNDQRIVSEEEGGGDKYSIGGPGIDYGSLRIRRTRFEDRGEYTCVYNNSIKTLPLSATLGVQVIPVIVDLAVPPNGTAGSDTVLTCISRGYPAPAISWFINDTMVAEQNSNKMSINVLTMEEVGGLYNVSSSLLINELELSDTNGYHCTATNELESVQTVTSPQLQFTVLYPPNITEPPVNKTINQTDDGVFNYVAQYVMTVSSTQDYHLLVNMMNQDIVGNNIYNDTLTIFSIQLHNTNDNSSTAVILVTVVIATEEGSGCPLRCREELIEFFNLRGSSFKPSFTVTGNITRFDGCDSEVTDSTFNWTEVNIGSTLRIDCPCGGLSLGTGSPVAIRACTGSFTNGASWTEPNTTQCDFTNDVLSLCNVTQLNSTFQKLTELESLIASPLDSVQLLITVSLMETLNAEASESNTSLDVFLNILERVISQDSDLLQSTQTTSNTSLRVLQIIDDTLAQMPLPSSSLIMTRPSFTLAVQEVPPSDGAVFSLSRNQSVSLTYSNTSTDPMSLILPSNFTFSSSDSVRLTHVIFNSSALFPNLPSNQRVASLVMATSLIGHTLSSLVNITFERTEVEESFSMEACNFFNFSLNGNQGKWSTKGCQTSFINNKIRCTCDHLTHFAVIATSSEAEPPTVEMADPPSYLLALESLSIVAVSFSLVFFIITLVLFLGTWKLRIKTPIQLLVNVCVSLLLLYLMYIGALYARTHENACIVFSSFLHYAFSVSLLSFVGHSIHITLKGCCMPIKHYTLIAVILCWVLPLFLVTFCVAPGYHLYTSQRFCIPQKVPFYVGFVVPFIVCSIVTGVSLLITGIMLARISFKSVLSQEYLSSLSLFLLFTIGWIMVLSKANASAPVAAALEAIFLVFGAPLGFYVFLMCALASGDVRTIWQKKFGKVIRKCSVKLNESTDASSKGKRDSSLPSSVKEPSMNKNDSSDNKEVKDRAKEDNASNSSDIDV